MNQQETNKKLNAQLVPLKLPPQPQPLSQIEVLSLVNEEKYDEAIKSLIRPQSDKPNEYETSNNWNIFLIKIIKENKFSKGFPHNLIQSLSSFFTHINNDDNDQEAIKAFPVIKLNEIIFYFTLGQYSAMINKYKKHIRKSSHDYILFVNSTLILIETCLLLNFNRITEQFITLLEHYFEYNTTTTSIGGEMIQGSKTIHRISMSYNTNNDKEIAYYNSNEIYHKDTNINKEIILLLKCYLHLNRYQCDKAQKNLNDYKSIYSMSHLKKSNPLYERLKRMYNILKIKLDFLNNSQFKCYKHLNYLCDNNSNKETCLFKHNSYGILNLKLKKVKYSEYYFSVALSIAKSDKNLFMKYWHCIIFNMALCSFYFAEYDKCYDRLISIKENEVMKNNPFYYYRLGLCLIEREFQSKGKQDIGNDIVKRFIRYSPIYSQVEGGVNEELNNCNGQSRFYNQTPGDNAAINIVNNNQREVNMNKGILLNQETTTIKEYSMIKEAIGCFKQCFLLLKGCNKYKDELNEISRELSKEEGGNAIKNNIIITNTNKNKVKDKYSNNNNDNNNKWPSSLSLSESDAKMSYPKIYSSSISNLLFCLLLTANYTEVIYYGNKYLNELIAKREQHLISNYIAEAYLHLGQTRIALEVLLNHHQSSSNDSRGCAYSSNSNSLYSDVNYQTALRINVLKIHYLQGNINEVEKGISQIMKIRKKELTPYLTNALLYYYLATKNKHKAISLISYRKIFDEVKE